METVDFGRTGLKVSRLAFGTGTHGWGGRSEQTAIGLDGLENLLRLGYDNGVNFWDTADAYGSHPHVARALRGLSRESVVIATKTMSRTPQKITQDIERFLRELNTDTLDIVLLHYVTHADWPSRYSDAMEALARAKERGKLRAVGVSCHGLGPLRAASESDWVDVALVRINYAGVNMDGKPDKVVPVIERMHRAGKAVYGMKVLGCSRLADDVRGAVDFVFGLGTVHAITIGISKAEQLFQNLGVVDELASRHPLQAQKHP